MHRNYDVDGVARVLGVHKNTVRNWLKHGLEAVDEHRPTLVLGSVLRLFLEARRAGLKRKCPPGHFFCVRCRMPKLPAGKMADYVPYTPTTGNLKGICPDCDGWVNRRCSLAKIEALQKILDIRFPQAHPRLSERA
jgi:hypothetical protein